MTLDRSTRSSTAPPGSQRLLPLGVRLVQLRIKDRPEPRPARQIAPPATSARRHGAALVVNDHWRLAIEEGCGFVHLGQEDLDTADLAAIRAAGLRLGLSTHDEAELDRALRRRPTTSRSGRSIR